MPLFKAGWAESGDDAFNPDIETGWLLWSNERLFFFECAGNGYAIAVLDRNIFTSIPFFNVISIYIKPEHRDGRVMLRLFRAVRRKARALHCSFLLFTIPHHKRNIEKFKRLSGGSYDLIFKVRI